MKPLGKKAYGSIPHLPGSRVGPGDYHIHEGQAIIATQKKRDKHDIIIVQEKLDGSNVAVAKVNGEIVALTRSGYLASSSQYDQHLFFDLWVKENEYRFNSLLKEGERLCGEWLVLAHGTRYNLQHEPFVSFDLMTGTKRLTFSEFTERVKKYNFITPYVLSMGEPRSISSMLEMIKDSGHGAIDDVEGAVWRIERKGVVDFLTKFVRPDKQDGKYFKELTGKDDVYNVDISHWMKSLVK